MLHRRIVQIRQQHFFHANHAAIFAAQTHGTHAVAFARLIDEIDDLSLHIAAQHTVNDAHGVGIGHAHPLHKLPFNADALEHRVNLRAAAMHHHHRHAHRGEQRHILRELLLQRFVGHGVATVFDHDGLVLQLRQALRRRGNARVFNGGNELSRFGNEFGHG